jgi:hypothetical protein
VTAEALRTTLALRPFTPFVIHLAGGGSVPVEDPGAVRVHPDGRLATVTRADGSRALLDLAHVTRLRVGPDGGGGPKP